MNFTLARLATRRRFLQTASLAAAGWVARDQAWPAPHQQAGSPTLTAADLPKGSAPPPVPCPHFPSRLHAYVWRNWPLVPVERLAHVVGARPEDLRRLGAAMGLGTPPNISREQQQRASITILRRNWHLLPYPQLLDLLDWSPNQLAYALREDDFLYIKLGNLKPQCDPLRYHPSDPQTRERERALAAIARSAFPDGPAHSADPLFSFVARLSTAPRAASQPTPAPGDPLRLCYSYFALYGDPLLDPAAAPYPDGYLERLAQAGVNGVWLQAVLYKLAPFPWDPGLSARHEDRLQHLRTLVARARQHGLRVFLYLNEPRAMPLAFYATRPQLQGVGEGDHAALCTSAPEVRDYLRNATASVCRAVPDLGGFFTITGSENLTHCWSHGAGTACPRCGARPAADVIAEVNLQIAEGIRAARHPVELVVWDWGWNDAWAEEIVRQLPPEAALMSVSEWSLPIERGGVKNTVGEYSISAVGPGPRARRHWELARRRGLKTVAKIQAGNSWELASVPYLPAVDNVAQHAARLRAVPVDGLMLGWTLGGYPSPNLEVVSETMGGRDPETAVGRVAARRFGPALAPAVTRAWRAFSAAFAEFPYDGDVLYFAPQQFGPANLLWAEPTGYQATMVGFPYDDLTRWRGVYPPEIFAAQMQKVADGWSHALNQLHTETRDSLRHANPSQRDALTAELRVAEAAAIHFRSTANQARFVLARHALRTATTPAQAGPAITTLERILRDELELAQRLHALQSLDARLGFEASNQYFFVPVDLAEKVLNCRDLLDRFLPEQRARWGLPS